MGVSFANYIDKLAVRMVSQRYFGNCYEYYDLRYVARFVGKEFGQKLPGLKVGEFIYNVKDSARLVKSPRFA